MNGSEFSLALAETIKHVLKSEELRDLIQYAVKADRVSRDQELRHAVVAAAVGGMLAAGTSGLDLDLVNTHALIGARAVDIADAVVEALAPPF